MTRQNVRAKARGLGAELADLRQQAGMTLREVPDRLDWSAPTIDQPGWWETSASALPGQLTALYAFESEATRMTEFGLVLVPGLLQTPEYVRALMESGRVPEDSKGRSGGGE